MDGGGVRTVVRRPPIAVGLTGAVLLGLWAVASSADRLADVRSALGDLPWPVIGLAAALPLFALAHYVAAAVAVRAASARPLPLRTTTYAQLSAAAANRLVPNGLGGNGLNVRFLQRSGVSPAGAVSAMVTLAIVGGLTDAAYATLVTSAGPAVGVRGATHELGILTAHGLRATQHVPWPAIALLAVVAVILLARRGLPRASAWRRSAGQVAQHLATLGRRPRDLLAMAAASLVTTAALSAGFAATVVTIGHGHPLPQVGALVTMYLVAAAIGGAAPLPALVGVTEAALVGALTVAGLPFATALKAVLVFRLVTFWAPLPLGLLAARRLRVGGLL